MSTKDSFAPNKSPLLEAIIDGDSIVVNRLLNEGNSPNLISHSELSPLQAAAREGYLDIVRMLIRAGADVNRGSDYSPLYEAVHQEHIEVIRELIAAGAELNQPVDEDDDTALLEAVSIGNFEIVRLLIESGADPNMQGEAGTPLLTAIEQKNQEIYEYLYPRVINEDILSLADERSAGCFSEINKSRKQQSKLVESFVNAASKGNIKKVAEYIQRGVNINSTNSEGETALVGAAACGNLKVVQALLKAGDDPDIFDLDEDGKPKKTALMELPACYWNPERLNIMQEVISKRANVNLQNLEGKTALMFALDWNGSVDEQYEAIRLLVFAGADVTTRDNEGFTILMQAQFKRLDKVISFLQLFGAKS